jgi:DNA-binding NarL/FixJ family response regulator
MHHVLIAGHNPARLLHVEQALAEHGGFDLHRASTHDQAMRITNETPISAAIVDEEFSDMSGAAFVRSLMISHPLINCALVSPLYSNEFHEATEGLGIFMQLPSPPDQQSGKALVDLLSRLLSITTS